MAAALLAFHHRLRIGHIEAGLRTGDKSQPFPEEANRRIVDVLTDLYFVPTETARCNLLREAIDDSQIIVTGNTVIDALLHVVDQPYEWANGPLSSLPRDKRLLLVTAHRRENFGSPLAHICAALRELAERFADDIHIVYPVHHNPNIQEIVFPKLYDVSNIPLLAPLGYLA